MKGNNGRNEPGTSRDARMWGAAAHLSAPVLALASGGLLCFLGPLAIWRARRYDAFVDYHGREALNFSLTLLVICLPLLILALLIETRVLGIGVIVVIFWLVFSIDAAVKAAHGRYYRYPVSFRIIR